MALQIQKDTKYTKLFVGGLPYHTTNETLRDYFLQFGDIEEAVVIHCKATGKSKGYGFVTMMDKEAAEKAIEDPNPYIDGRRANVNLAYLGAKPKLGSPGSPLAPIHHNGFSPFPGPPHMSPPPTSNGVPFMSPIPPYFVEVPPFGPPNGPFIPPYGQMYPFFQPPFGFMPQNAPHQPMLNHPTVAN